MRTKQKREVFILLPNKQHLGCAVTVTARGQDVLNVVLELLGVRELHVFGLAVLRDNECLFLDLNQKLSKYFGKQWNSRSLKVPFILFLRVQYYVESGRLILSSKVLQLYYTELRQKVLQSQSRHQEALFFQLAASALQAETGDLEQREGEGSEGEGSEEEEEGRRQEGKHRHYFLPEDYFPSWLIKRRGRDYLQQHSPALHGELRGLSRRRAMLQFIKEANRLQDGPVTLYRMRQDKKEVKSLILLGVALRGVHIYQEMEGKQCLLYDFSWTDIDRLTFQGNRFEIHAASSLCLPKLVYYAPSRFHSKHVLRHLVDSHRLHMSTRDTVHYVQQLEDMQASQFYKEAYICDMAGLRQRLHNNSLASSMCNGSVGMQTTTGRPEEDEEGEEGYVTGEVEMCVDEPDEVLVDSPAEVPWLAELLHGESVDGPSWLPSSYWDAITVEMKQDLRRRAHEEASVD